MLTGSPPVSSWAALTVEGMCGSFLSLRRLLAVSGDAMIVCRGRKVASDSFRDEVIEPFLGSAEDEGACGVTPK